MCAVVSDDVLWNPTSCTMSCSWFFTFRTENTGMIVGLGRAAQLVTDNVDRYFAHMSEIRDYLEAQLEVSENIVVPSTKPLVVQCL